MLEEAGAAAEQLVETLLELLQIGEEVARDSHRRVHGGLLLSL
jgi:hypothetical protein